jgi:hypothetical protein
MEIVPYPRYGEPAPNTYRFTTNVTEGDHSHAEPCVTVLYKKDIRLAVRVRHGGGVLFVLELVEGNPKLEIELQCKQYVYCHHYDGLANLFGRDSNTTFDDAYRIS